MRDPDLVVSQRLFYRHLDVPWDHTNLIDLQTVLKLKVGECTHETLDKVLTESVSPLGVDPTLDRPGMFTCRKRTGQEHDLEDQSPELRPGFEECLDPDMNIRLDAPFVESPRFTIFHITVEVVSTCRASNPDLLILKFHKYSRRNPRCFGKIRNDLVKVRVGTLVRVTSAKFRRLYMSPKLPPHIPSLKRKTLTTDNNTLTHLGGRPEVLVRDEFVDVHPLSPIMFQSQY